MILVIWDARTKTARPMEDAIFRYGAGLDGCDENSCNVRTQRNKQKKVLLIP